MVIIDYWKIKIITQELKIKRETPLLQTINLQN